MCKECNRRRPKGSFESLTLHFADRSISISMDSLVECSSLEFGPERGPKQLVAALADITKWAIACSVRDDILDGTLTEEECRA